MLLWICPSSLSLYVYGPCGMSECAVPSPISPSVSSETKTGTQIISPRHHARTTSGWGRSRPWGFSSPGSNGCAFLPLSFSKTPSFTTVRWSMVTHPSVTPQLPPMSNSPTVLGIRLAKGGLALACNPFSAVDERWTAEGECFRVTFSTCVTVTLGAVVIV